MMILQKNKLSVIDVRYKQSIYIIKSKPVINYIVITFLPFLINKILLQNCILNHHRFYLLSFLLKFILTIFEKQSLKTIYFYNTTFKENLILCFVRFGLNKFWNALSVNRDYYDLEYISTIEVIKYIQS